ncbi:MAG: hypothetical protein DMF05_12680 [Verrucomicrobia bacterium]|jgi:hypothetical protein|nr:MAG: hypothetical protein DMF05_12680 [Verrucomicrobiota bacterium]
MADYLLFQKAQRKSFSMNSAKTTKDDTARAFGLALSGSPLRVPETQSAFIRLHVFAQPKVRPRFLR